MDGVYPANYPPIYNRDLTIYDGNLNGDIFSRNQTNCSSNKENE